MGGSIPKSFGSGYLSDEERRKREQGQRQQNQATNFANSTTTKAPYGSSQALAWQQPQSNFVPNQQQAANDPWSQSGALEKQRQQQQQEAERLQKQVLQNSQQSQQMAAEEVPEFKTTSEAVGYFYDKQHPYGGYTKITGPLGDISYYDENLYKPKEPQSAPNMGFARTSATQPMAFANQAFGREQNNPLLTAPPERKPRYAELGFDGRDLSWVENEEIKKSWPAMSGQPDYQGQEFTNVKNKGPIPEGMWNVNQENAQDYDDLPLANKIISAIGGLTKRLGKPLGGWPGGTYSWGTHRIPLEADENTDTQGRTNPFIHGGSDLGSAGCVDLAQNMDDFWEWYRKYGRNMRMNVRYPKKYW